MNYQRILLNELDDRHQGNTCCTPVRDYQFDDVSSNTRTTIMVVIRSSFCFFYVCACCVLKRELLQITGNKYYYFCLLKGNKSKILSQKGSCIAKSINFVQFIITLLNGFN